MNQPVELVIWDMDGTLINSSSAVPDAFIAAANSVGKTGYSRQDVIDLYNLGVPENVVSHIQGQQATPETMNVFYDALQANSRAVKTYDDIPHCLETIRKHAKQAVFTGASHRSAEILLKSVGINHHFDLILGGDDYPPKPDPSALIAMAAQFGVDSIRCAYVGDAATDIQAANAANVKSIAAGWGHLYTPGTGASITAPSPTELCHLLGF